MSSPTAIPTTGPDTKITYSNDQPSNNIHSGESSNSIGSTVSNTMEYNENIPGIHHLNHHNHDNKIDHKLHSNIESPEHEYHHEHEDDHDYDHEHEHHDDHDHDHDHDDCVSRDSSSTSMALDKHSTSTSGKRISHNKSSQNIVFIHKLYDILENKELKHLIWWSENGKSFFIKPNEKFSKALAKYFKHTNITSFVRQLNIYGFHKVTNLNESNSTMSEKEKEKFAESSDGDPSTIKIWEFKHSAGIFKRGDRESLKLIKRRSGSRNNSNAHRKRVNLIGGHPSHSRAHGSSLHSNLSYDVENNFHRQNSPNLSAEQINMLRSHSSFTPYSSNDNISNLQNSYNNIPHGLLSNSQQITLPNSSQLNGLINLQNKLNLSNETMLEQFHLLNNDMLQMLTILQNFVTLQNSINIHENPTQAISENFQNQYNMLYHNISNMKNELATKYQNVTSSFYERQQYLSQPTIPPLMQNQNGQLNVPPLNYQQGNTHQEINTPQSPNVPTKIPSIINQYPSESIVTTHQTATVTPIQQASYQQSSGNKIGVTSTTQLHQIPSINASTKESNVPQYTSTSAVLSQIPNVVNVASKGVSVPTITTTPTVISNIGTLANQTSSNDILPNQLIPIENRGPSELSIRSVLGPVLKEEPVILPPIASGSKNFTSVTPIIAGERKSESHEENKDQLLVNNNMNVKNSRVYSLLNNEENVKDEHDANHVEKKLKL